MGGGGEGFTLHTPGVPEPIHLFQSDGKVVLAYGDAAAADALAPAETLGDSQDYRDAEEALGGDYDLSFYLAFEPLGALVAGANKDGDKLRSAFGITVK